MTTATLIASAALEVTFGCDLLDSSDQLVEDISDSLRLDGSSISRNMNANIHGTCILNISEEFSWHSQRVRPWVTLVDQRTGETQKWNLGVYLCETPARVAGESPQTFYLEGYDKLVLLQSPVGSTYTVAAGTSYVTAVGDVLTAAGISGYIIDTSSAATVADEKVWPLHEDNTWLRVVNDLLGAIGYRAIYVDRDGVFRSEAYVAPSGRTPVWAYDSTAANTIVEDGLLTESDLWQIPNRWVFYRDDPNITLPSEGAGIYTVVNQSDGPTSIDQRGRTITRVVPLDVANQTALVTRGSSIVEQDRQPLVHLDFSTSVNPLHWHGESFTMTSPELGLTADVFSEQEWSIRFDGVMRHKGRKAVI